MNAFYLTLSQCCEILGCSDEHVRRAIHRGDLAAFKDGRLVRVARTDLDAYIAAHTVTPKRLRSARRRAA